MLFTVQKIIWFIIMPPASIIILMLLGLAVSRRRRAAGLALISAATLLLYLLSLGPVASWLVAPLERYPPLHSLPAQVDAVVVPGAGSVNLARFHAAPVPSAETLSRLVKGVELARQLHCPLVLSGGNGEPFATILSDAEIMAQTAFAMGMPRNQVIVENRSRNTLENSREVRKIVSGRRIVLATSAYYMRRAVTMFQKRGFEVIPAPVFYFGQQEKMNLSLLIPQAGALAASKIALAEWVSMVWWRIRGEI